MWRQEGTSDKQVGSCESVSLRSEIFIAGALYRTYGVRLRQLRYFGSRSVAKSPRPGPKSSSRILGASAATMLWCGLGGFEYFLNNDGELGTEPSETVSSGVLLAETLLSRVLPACTSSTSFCPTTYRRHPGYYALLWQEHECTLGRMFSSASTLIRFIWSHGAMARQLLWISPILL